MMDIQFSSVQFRQLQLTAWYLLKVTQRIPINDYNGDVSGDSGDDDGGGAGHDSAVGDNDRDTSL